MYWFQGSFITEYPSVVGKFTQSESCLCNLILTKATWLYFKTRKHSSRMHTACLLNGVFYTSSFPTHAPPPPPPCPHHACPLPHMLPTATYMLTCHICHHQACPTMHAQPCMPTAMHAPLPQVSPVIMPPAMTPFFSLCCSSGHHIIWLVQKQNLYISGNSGEELIFQVVLDCTKTV